MCSPDPEFGYESWQVVSMRAVGMQESWRDLGTYLHASAPLTVQMKLNALVQSKRCCLEECLLAFQSLEYISLQLLSSCNDLA